MPNLKALLLKLFLLRNYGLLESENYAYSQLDSDDWLKEMTKIDNVYICSDTDEWFVVVMEKK